MKQTHKTNSKLNIPHCPGGDNYCELRSELLILSSPLLPGGPAAPTDRWMNSNETIGLGNENGRYSTQQARTYRSRKGQIVFHGGSIWDTSGGGCCRKHKFQGGGQGEETSVTPLVADATWQI